VDSRHPVADVALGWGPVAVAAGTVALLVCSIVLVIFVREPGPILSVLAVIVGLGVGVVRPDLFIYFLIITISLNFGRAVGGYPVALEQLKILAPPLIILNLVVGGKFVTRLRVRSAYLWAIIGILVAVALSFSRANNLPVYLRDTGRLVLGICGFWAVLNIGTTWARQRLLMYSLLAGALLLSLLVLAQIATQSYTPIYSFVRGEFFTPFSPMRADILPFDGRGQGFSGPNETGGYIAIVLPIGFYLAATAKRKLPLYLTLGVMWLALFLTFGRIAVFGGVVGSLLFMKLQGGSLWRLLRVIFPCVLLTYLVLSSASVQSVFSERVSGTEDMAADRLGVWGYVWDSVSKHPLIGVGFGNMEGLLVEASGTFEQENALNRLYGAHNQYLEVLMSLGVFGLALYLWLLTRPIHLGLCVWRNPNLSPRRLEVVAPSCACFVIIILGITESPLSMSQVGYVCWVVFALVETAHRLVMQEYGHTQGPAGPVAESVQGSRAQLGTDAALQT